MKITNLKKYPWNYHCGKYAGTWCGDAVLHGEHVELFAPDTIEDESEARSFMRGHEITRKAFLPVGF